MSYSVRVPLTERAASTPLPVMRREVGRDPAQILQVHMRRGHLEVVEHRVAAAR